MTLKLSMNPSVRKNKGDSMSLQFMEELSLLQARFTLAVLELANAHKVDEEEALRQAINTFNNVLKNDNLKEIFKGLKGEN